VAFENIQQATFNRGIVDKRALGRVDIKRVALSAETQTNWVPRTLGSMTLRPGTERITNQYQDRQAKHIPFIFSTDDTYLIEVTGGNIRVVKDDDIIVRATANTDITNGTFDTDLTGWTDADEAGTTSAYKTGGFMSLTGTRFNSAKRWQLVSVSNYATSSPVMLKCDEPLVKAKPSKLTGGQPNYITVAQTTGVPTMALRIVIERGEVVLAVGKAAGTTEYLSEILDTGTHSLEFQPNGNFYITFSSKTRFEVLVDSVSVETGGEMVIPAPWSTDQLSTIRWTQSANTMFVASDPSQQYTIKRRQEGRSWSVARYEANDGPFRNVNTTTTTLAGSATTGDITVTASEDVFNSGHVGAIFRLSSAGQTVAIDVTAENQFSDAVRVTGRSSARDVIMILEGTWTADVTVQRSLDDGATYTSFLVRTINTTGVTVNDGLVDVEALFRVGVATGDLTSGTVEAQLTQSGGGQDGVVRITSFTSPTSVGASVLTPLGDTNGTTDWNEGIWSAFRGWPTATVLYEGRLWWVGHDWIIGSVSDGFSSFDDTLEGNSRPIIRTLASGPTDDINWLLAIQRLIIGTEGAELSARASAFDELLTADDFNIKEASTLGSAPIQPVKLDSRGILVDKSKFHVYDISFDFAANDYVPTDLSLLVPDIGRPGFTHLELQRDPDLRLHLPRSDGTVAILLYDPAEDVRAWVNFKTGDGDGINGVVEDIVTLPGIEEERVYYSILRIIDGKERRFLEKWALESECIGETLNKQADCFIEIHQTASSTISGLDHLEGEAVVVWDNGICLRDTSDDIATFTVSSGSITLTNNGVAYEASNAIVGLPYSATFVSAKLPYAANLGTTLGTRQRISKIGLIVQNTHHRGLEFGRDITNVDPLPQVIDGAVVDADTIHSFLDEDRIAFPGETTSDTRVVLKASAPRPVTVIAAPLGIGTSETAP
jgi:hypothetical protein